MELACVATLLAEDMNLAGADATSFYGSVGWSAAWCSLLSVQISGTRVILLQPRCLGYWLVVLLAMCDES